MLSIEVKTPLFMYFFPSLFSTLQNLQYIKGLKNIIYENFICFYKISLTYNMVNSFLRDKIKIIIFLVICY